MPRTGPRPRLDVDLLRQACAGRMVDILAALTRIPAESLDGKHHPCPWCGGSDRFRLINAEQGTVLCNQCFNAKNQGVFAAIQHDRKCDFKEAIHLVADYIGFEGPPATKAVDAAPVVWQEWNDLPAELWRRNKKPIGLAPLRKVRARLGIYRNEHPIIGIPAWGEAGENADPVNFVFYPRNGQALPLWNKTKKRADWHKILTLPKGLPGWIGNETELATATHVWLVEGPSDLLALLSFDLPAGHAVLSNCFGAGEKAEVWMLARLRGKTVYLLRDADDAGELSADKWSLALLDFAAETRVLKLPFPVVRSHGKDLRDYFNEGGSVASLLAIAEQTKPVQRGRITQPAQLATATAPSILVIEGEADPHRLARCFLKTHTIKYWQGNYYAYTGTHYEARSNEWMRAAASQVIKGEFDRFHAESRSSETKQVTIGLVSNVVEAIRSQTYCDDKLPLNSWQGEQPGPRDWIAFQNGILCLDQLLAGKPDNLLLPHDPRWFSITSLPYDFNLEADCPRWQAFLEEMQEEDHERIAILQEWCGYSLLPTTDLQKFLAIEGDGNNGKSVFMAGLTALLGIDNISYTGLGQLDNRFALAAMLGKLANIEADCPELDKAAEHILKKLASGDPMQFERKGKDPFAGMPTARLVFSFNNRPRISDKTRGVWRRLLLIPWRVEPKKIIRGMDKWQWWVKSGELPGMFLWAVAGLARLRSQAAFTESQLAAESIEQYQDEMNPERQFLKLHIEQGDGQLDSVGVEDLYERYQKWMGEQGSRYLVSVTKFGIEVTRMFRRDESFRKCRVGSGRGSIYRGVKWIAGMGNF